MKKTALIMAGGRGERFWPRSRRTLPKQFLSLTDDGKTMIQLTVERILPLVEMEDIYIATNTDYASLVKEQLPLIPEKNILCEPIGRNTAPCIALGAAHIEKNSGESLMIILPSDHLIKHNKIFISTLKEACNIADTHESLVTLGITPDYPETGYGYIKYKGENSIGSAFEVDCFVEKPTKEKAKEYLASDDYLWNSGMFVWKTSTILNCFQNLLPDTYTKLIEIQNAIGTSVEKEVLNRVFPEFPSISIDYGIMEKSTNIYTIPSNFGWDDVGSWLAVERIKKTNEAGNIITGNVISIDTENCIIEGDKKLISTIGLRDLVIVDTEDAILICDKHHTADIKRITETLRICNKNEYL